MAGNACLYSLYLRNVCKVGNVKIIVLKENVDKYGQQPSSTIVEFSICGYSNNGNIVFASFLLVFFVFIADDPGAEQCEPTCVTTPKSRTSTDKGVNL